MIPGETNYENALQFLLNSDRPGVRYLALRDLLRRSADDPEVISARITAYRDGPIGMILQNMGEDGCWVQPGASYNPKYRSPVWSIIALAQCGAKIQDDPRLKIASQYIMDNCFHPGGQFSTSQGPSGTVDCLQGNLCWALVTLGYEDSRLEDALDWMARTVTGEGLAQNTDRQARQRYYAYKCGPLFTCGANNQLSCAWGGVKVMLAFSVWPKTHWTERIEQAVCQGAEFLLNGNPARANYPNGYSDKPSQNWWKFGFPVFYVTDLLQNVECLVELGYGKDPRLIEAIAIIREKQDEHGRWSLDYDYSGKTWGDYGKQREPNPWVTLRVLKVLKAVIAD